ncbi:MAG: GNAT family N-acetyltransferase [Actinomycetota bacterium]
MKVTTRAATAADATAIESLLPRLAAFDPLPPGRARDDLWRPDLAGLQTWASGERPDTSVRVATTGEDVVGAGIVTYGPDPFTEALNAHLLAIVVAPSVDGHGIGQRLMAELDDDARRRGAATMSLNVFVQNERARALYARLGFHEELIRAVRPLT